MAKELLEIMGANWKNALKRTMQKNGFHPSEEEISVEDILKNLYYLSKEGSDGKRFIPLHELRILEKLVCGMFNTTFEFDDKTDVYCERVGETYICYANVRYVKILENGEKIVLGHGFNAKTLEQVSVPNVFNPTKEQRAAYWKAQTIGGAKSRALFEAGFGIEFYGDPMSLVEDDLPNETENADSEAPSVPPTASAKEKEKEFSASGLPVPKAKRGRPKKEEVVTESSVKEKEEKEESETTTFVPTMPNPSELTLEEAMEVVADIGNYKGMTLSQVVAFDPRALIFLTRNSTEERVKEAAKIVAKTIPALAEKFSL